MSIQILILAATTLLAFGLMMLVNLSPDIAALLVMITLGLTGILTPAESFSGFSSQVVIILLGAFIMTRALTVTGVTQRMSRFLSQAGTGHQDSLPLIVMSVGAGLSLFMNKVVAASLVLPVASHAAQRRSVPLYKVMMPLAFATSLGGMATLLNTGNLVVSYILNSQGYKGFGLLEFLPVGLPVALIGIVCILLLLRHYTPRAGINERPSAHSLKDKLITSYELGERINYIQIPVSSTIAGKTLKESRIGEKYLLTVLSIHGKEQIRLAPAGCERIAPGDHLIVVGRGGTTQSINRIGCTHRKRTQTTG